MKQGGQNLSPGPGPAGSPRRPEPPHQSPAGFPLSPPTPACARTNIPGGKLPLWDTYVNLQSPEAAVSWDRSSLSQYFTRHSVRENCSGDRRIFASVNGPKEHYCYVLTAHMEAYRSG